MIDSVLGSAESLVQYKHMSKSRKRAITTTSNKIGQERYERYKSAFSWISHSILEGYYLEAVSIIESLLSDRLESYLSFLLQSNCGFQNLGPLINKAKAHVTDEALLSSIEEVNLWRKARNKAAHEMVKIEAGISISWEDRKLFNKETAETGLLLVRKVDRRIRQLHS